MARTASKTRDPFSTLPLPRASFYRALVALGCEKCPGCGDYVLPEVHECSGVPGVSQSHTPIPLGAPHAA
jgi:hypothetical protein